MCLFNSYVLYSCFLQPLWFSVTSNSFFYQVWDVRSGCRLSQPLRLHQSWVTDIRFDRDGLRMVTVGDKIAWWSLDSLRFAGTSAGGGGGRRTSLQVRCRRLTAISVQLGFTDVDLIFPIQEGSPTGLDRAERTSAGNNPRKTSRDSTSRGLFR